MLRKALICLLLISLAGIAVAQELSNDVIDVKYDKKSTKVAMALSAIFPGAGQYYANPKSITTYLFPLIEAGLWYGYLQYNNEGDDSTNDYEKWANQEPIGQYSRDSSIIIDGEPLFVEGQDKYRYERIRYDFASTELINNPLNNSTFYDTHFKLDETDTQHFYEDIAKYDKYIIGWADWFDVYASSDDDIWVSPSWQWETDPTTGVNKWIGNEVLNEDSEYYDPEIYGDMQKNSGMRSEYIKMRQDTEEFYDKVDNIKFGLILNRVLASFDAMRLARNHNRNYLASNDKLKISVTPIYVNNELSPALMLSKSF